MNDQIKEKMSIFVRVLAGWENILSSEYHRQSVGRMGEYTVKKPHLYIVKLGFTGVYIIFLTSAQNIDCGYR